jgi:hypothetical protein
MHGYDIALEHVLLRLGAADDFRPIARHQRGGRARHRVEVAHRDFLIRAGIEHRQHVADFHERDRYEGIESITVAAAADDAGFLYR